MRGLQVVRIAEAFGWHDSGPGSNHPHVLKRKGARSVPVRDRLENRLEVQSILKQLGVPREDWPEKVR